MRYLQKLILGFVLWGIVIGFLVHMLYPPPPPGVPIPSQSQSTLIETATWVAVLTLAWLTVHFD